MQFEQLKQKPIDQIEDQLLTHHEVSYKLWEKIVFPVYLWKSLIHAKHEAFRFKYVTSKLLELE